MGKKRLWQKLQSLKWLTSLSPSDGVKHLLRKRLSVFFWLQDYSNLKLMYLAEVFQQTQTKQRHSYQLHNQPPKLRCLNFPCKLQDIIIIYADDAAYWKRTTSVMAELPWAGPYLILCKCQALRITMLLILFISEGNKFFRYSVPFLLGRTTEPLMVTYAYYLLPVAPCVYIKKRQQIWRCKWNQNAYYVNDSSDLSV